MKRGILIANGFYDTPKSSAQYAALEAAFAVRGIALDTLKGLSAQVGEDNSLQLPSAVAKADFGILWDKDLFMGTQLEACGLRLFNSVSAVALCDDKARMHAAFAAQSLPVPRTIVAPFSFENIGYTDTSFVEDAGRILGYPMIIKECGSSLGMGVYLAQNYARAREIAVGIRGGFIMQEFVAESFGRDLRVYVAGGRVICAAARRNIEFRSNVECGGVMSAAAADTDAAKLAIAAARAVGADFAGVDLLFGKDGMLLCEINSSANVTTLSEVCGVDVAGAVVEHVIREAGL